MTAKNNHPELLEQLTEGIANLTSSDEWQRYLDFQSRFHRYSFGNVLLIAAQCHEATRVAGFNAWRKMNRFVRKGEKAIWILAPMVYKNADAEDGESDRVIRGFKFVPVFDVAQTDGEELPSVCNRLDGDDPAGHYAQLVDGGRSPSASRSRTTSSAAPRTATAPTSEHRIRVEIRNTPAQRVKTLAHEIAHALLHENFKDRALAELEAESTAYVVCQALGIDTSDYSFGYVATWAGGGDEAIAGIKASCERIQKTAATILRAFEPAAEMRRRHRPSSLHPTADNGGMSSRPEPDLLRSSDRQCLLSARFERGLPLVTGSPVGSVRSRMKVSSLLVRERAPRRREHEHPGRATWGLLVATWAQPRPPCCMADPDGPEGRTGRSDLAGDCPRDDAGSASARSVS